MNPRVPMDPRIRRRRVEVIRAQGRRRRRRLAIALSIVTVTGGVTWLLTSALTSARHVTVQGAVHTPVAEILAAGGLAHHPQLVALDEGAMEAAIERLPWVAGASVHRSWPDAVVVTVTERTPAACVAVSQKTCAEVDASGRVLADVATVPPGLLLVSTPFRPGPPGSTVPGPGLDALGVVRALPAGLAGIVLSVGVDRSGDVRLQLDGGVTALVGGTGELPTKVRDLLAITGQVPLHPGDVVDVRVPESPVVSSASTSTSIVSPGGTSR